MSSARSHHEAIRGHLLLPLSELPDPLPIPTLAQVRGAPGMFLLRMRPPGSKSLTNRAVLLAALADGESRIDGALIDADDTRRMMAAVERMGASVTQEGERLSIRGVGGCWKPAGTGDVRLELHNAGTAVRFLTAAALLSPRPVTIDGDARMRERPIGELVGALEALGATAIYLGEQGNPPVRIEPPEEILNDAPLGFGPTASSQFISALLLIAPFLTGGLTLELQGPITSESYLDMTLGMLEGLGASVRTSVDHRFIRIGGGGIRPFRYTVEPDASSASYFWAAAAIVPTSCCRVEGLDGRSLQGDCGFPELLERMGAFLLREEGAQSTLGIRGPASLDPIMADMTRMPDAAMTLASVACFARGRSILRGLGTLRIKESDRLAALRTELAKVGVEVQSPVMGDPDSITVMPPAAGIDCSPGCPPVVFETYNDHRMAMSLALIGLRRPNTSIAGPACTAKSFPGFWRQLAELY